MIKKSLLIGAALAVSFGASAGPNKGDWEISFSTMNGGLAIQDGNWELDAAVRAGYFFTQNHEIGVEAALMAFDYDLLGSDEMLGLGGFYRYNWQNGEQKDWWFAGADLMLQDVEEAGDTIVLRPHFGHKWMLSDDVAFDLEAGVSFDVDNSDNDPILDVAVGLTIFF